MAAARYPPHPLGPRLHPGASAMPGAQPPFPIYVLNHAVDVDMAVRLTGKPEPGRGWSKIPCASRRAYGCGKSIQEALDALALYVRLGDGQHLNSSLAIRMTEGARRRFELELDPDYYGRRDARRPSDLIARARVQMAEEHGVTVILLSFTCPASCFKQPQLVYYLVYNTIGSSLSMFQICKGVYEDEGFCTLRPIVPKLTGGGNDYNLLLLCREVSSCNDYFGVASLSSSEGGEVWKCKALPLGLIHEAFNVDVAFSCQGKAFWGDLEQGLLYCDLQSSDFGFVKLPCEYKDGLESDYGGVRDTRTMGCVGGDSIWFVCIDIPSHYTNAVVCIWELVLPEEEVQKGKVMGEGAGWKEVVEEVPFKVLWELSSFKKAGLPEAPFQYPTLTPEGALCLVLVDQSLFPKGPPLVDHFCVFDMHYKRLLWHGLVQNYPITESLVMYPSSSFLDISSNVPSGQLLWKTATLQGLRQ